VKKWFKVDVSKLASGVTLASVVYVGMAFFAPQEARAYLCCYTADGCGSSDEYQCCYNSNPEEWCTGEDGPGICLNVNAECP